MAAKKSDKSCFQSNYGAGWISGPQHLAEKMCVRMAYRDGESLPNKFWNLPKWRSRFLQQLNIAQGLLKIYSLEAIIAAITDCEAVWSLGAKFLDPIIREHEKKILAKQNAEPDSESKITIDVASTNAKPRPVFQDKQGLSSKLKDL